MTFVFHIKTVNCSEHVPRLWYTEKTGPRILRGPKTLWGPRTVWGLKTLWVPRTLWGPWTLGGPMTLEWSRTLRGPKTRIIFPIKYGVWLKLCEWMYDAFRICIFGFHFLEAIPKVKSASKTIIKRLLKIQ